MGQQYVKITADVVNTFAARNGSGDIPPGGDQTVTEGFIVNWDPVQGFTEQGWENVGGQYAAYSPISGLDWEYVQNDMADGDLNDVFASWESRVPDTWKRLDWIRAVQSVNRNCVTEVSA